MFEGRGHGQDGRQHQQPQHDDHQRQSRPRRLQRVSAVASGQPGLPGQVPVHVVSPAPATKWKHEHGELTIGIDIVL